MPARDDLSISMQLQNQGHDFISRTLALKIANLIVTETYPTSLFVPGSEGEIMDEGAAWIVSLRNKLRDRKNPLVAPVIKVMIRKSDGAILDLPAN